MTTFCNRVQLSTGGTAYLLVNYKNEDSNEFLLSLFDGNNVWKGKFDEDDIENIKKTKDALTCEYSPDLSYEYKLNSQRTDFQWHYAPDADISYMLGSCALKPASDPFKSLCEILDHCIDRNKEMKERLSAVQTDYDRISQERVNVLQKLEKCAVAKEELEKELCTKCIDVLNSNKEKNGQINNANGDLLAGPSHAEEDPIKTGVKRAKKRSAPSDDEERDQGKSDADATHKKKSTPRKSKKAMTKSPQKDDSVVLDTLDSSIVTSLVSRPRRNAEANKQKIPSKPVFPKVTPSKQKQRNAYDSNFKLEVLSFAEKHTNAETMRYFGINEKLIRDWKKAKAKLKALEKPVKKIRFNSSPVEEIEKELIAWVTNSIDQGHIVNRGAIRLKALEYATKDNTLASQDFKASAGWCTRFMKRHGLCFQNTKRESEQSASSKKRRTTSSSSFAPDQFPDNIDLEDLIDNL